MFESEIKIKIKNQVDCKNQNRFPNLDRDTVRTRVQNWPTMGFENGLKLGFNRNFKMSLPGRPHPHIYPPGRPSHLIPYHTWTNYTWSYEFGLKNTYYPGPMNFGPLNSG